MTQLSELMTINALRLSDLKVSPSCSHPWIDSVYAHRCMSSSIPGVWREVCHSLTTLDRFQLSDARGELTPEVLLAIGDQLAAYIHEDMEQAALPFHNYLHVCDALVSASYINAIWHKKSCAGERDVPGWRSSDAALLLFSVLVHDWGHDGGPVDRIPNLETLTIQRVTKTLSLDLGLDRSLVSCVNELISPLILSTDPRNVEELHQRWIISNSPDLWLQVLITECDVAASFMTNLGPYLSQCLLLEKANWDQENLSVETLNAYAASKSWRQFIRSAQVSSPCADALGWKTLCRVGSS